MKRDDDLLGNDSKHQPCSVLRGNPVDPEDKKTGALPTSTCLKERKMTKRIFADTEFTSNFGDGELISAGLVTEDGREFYVELSDGWTTDECTPFVLSVVLPLLDHDPDTTMGANVAADSMAAWLRKLGDVEIVVDARDDEYLLKLLLGQRVEDLSIAWRYLTWESGAEALAFDHHIEALFENVSRRHHALVDARVLRNAYFRHAATALHAVPIHDVDGFPYYVRMDEIPDQWRARFQDFLYSRQMPVFDGVACVYAWDWREFIGRNT